MITRILLSAALLILALPVAAEPVKAWPFKVYLNDTEIGYHRFELLRGDGGEEIRSRARYEVTLLFVTLYRYHHDNVERWRGDSLLSLDSITDDNGEQFAVHAQALPDSLRVQVNGEAHRYEMHRPMSFAYWHPAFLNATQLLHPQTGKLVDVRIEATGIESVKVGNETVDAQRYTLSGPQMRIELFYSQQGEWLALDAPVSGGRTLRYRLERAPECNAEPSGKEACT